MTPHLRRLNSDPVSREAAANITADLGECGAFSDCNSCTYEYDYTWASGSKEPLVSAAAVDTGCPILLGPLCFCYFLGF